MGSTVCTIEKENEKEKEQVLKLSFFFSFHAANVQIGFNPNLIPPNVALLSIKLVSCEQDIYV